jgi:hypothetical protein
MIWRSSERGVHGEEPVCSFFTAVVKQGRYELDFLGHLVLEARTGAKERLVHHANADLVNRLVDQDRLMPRTAPAFLVGQKAIDLVGRDLDIHVLLHRSGLVFAADCGAHLEPVSELEVHAAVIVAILVGLGVRKEIETKRTYERTLVEAEESCGRFRFTGYHRGFDPPAEPLVICRPKGQGSEEAQDESEKKRALLHETPP